MKYKIENLNEINIIAKKIIDQIGKNKIIIFDGEMGAGKTTLIKSICENLGVEQIINSPTFSIVNEYETQNEIIYHFDCYRINSIREAQDFGAEEYLNSGNICLIEWAEKIESLLPDSYLKIKITQNDNNSRDVELSQL